jgi:hypothetical protein
VCEEESEETRSEVRSTFSPSREVAAVENVVHQADTPASPMPLRSYGHPAKKNEPTSIIQDSPQREQWNSLLALRVTFTLVSWRSTAAARSVKAALARP